MTFTLEIAYEEPHLTVMDFEAEFDVDWGHKCPGEEREIDSCVLTEVRIVDLSLTRTDACRLFGKEVVRDWEDGIATKRAYDLGYDE